jgi:UrcA family protein
MYSNHLSAAQCGRNRSIFNATSRKEPVTGIAKIVRTNAIRIAWVMFSYAPIAMIAGAAQAGEPADAPPHKVVSFRDLNLNTTEGAEVLYKRIKSAAKEVCGVSYSFDLARMYVPQTCISEAVARAVAQVDRPMLTSLYQVKTGKAKEKVTTLAKMQ